MGGFCPGKEGKFLVRQGKMLGDKGKACPGQSEVVGFTGGGTEDVVQLVIDGDDMMTTGEYVLQKIGRNRVQNSRVGNVFDKRLADLWTNEFEAYRDYDKFQKCSKCELKAWCRGWPAVASSTSDGDFYAADPQCWKEI